ncbi:helix-turn-helix transcriptional regulator [Streptomyces sp. NPDC026672]|uniref:helix-turn-helix domain-containing protein n=1 Tax=unclassified Streptomyces TaxID=2593676 RepID=UPI00340A70FC
MAHIRELDPSASPLDYFGSELRRKREEAGLKQSQLGDAIFCTGSLIGQIETARKVPTREFAERADAALLTDGFFSRLVGLVLRSQLPHWFQPYAEMEAKAEYISTFQCQLVYGLLQTPEYAGALRVFSGLGQVEEMVAARMERQRILNRSNPPALWVVLGEAVLLHEVGGHEVMRAQLAHLLKMQERPWLHIQVLPLTVGAHSGMRGSFTMLRFDDDPDLFYCETYDNGHMTANSKVIRERSIGYAHLQACALSPESSADLITQVMEERYGEQSAAGESHNMA